MFGSTNQLFCSLYSVFSWIVDQLLTHKTVSWFFFLCFLREHHLSDHRRRAAEGAAASQESEEEGENTSRSVCDGSDEASSAQSHRRLLSFSVCTPSIPRPSHIVRCEQRRCELLYSLKKADFINERVTCGAFYDCGFSILLFLTLSSCLRWLFQSHDGCGCWRCGRIPELLPDRTGHNEEATLLNRLSNLHPRHTCSHCNNLVDLQVELLFTAEGWLLTQYNVLWT